MFFDYVHLFLSNTEQNLTRKFTNTFYFHNLNHGYIIFVYIFNAEITLRYVPTSLCAHFVMRDRVFLHYNPYPAPTHATVILPESSLPLRCFRLNLPDY